jgi:tyramine---L-glutamate ligase
MAFEGNALKVLVYEYVSGGGYAGQAIPASILAEGYAMLRSITSDFRSAGHEVTVLLDERITRFNPPLDADYTVTVFSGEEPQRIISTTASTTDAILIIGPETDQILQKLVRTVEQTGRISLNCTPDAIAALSGKAQLTDFLKKNGYATPKTLVLETNDKTETLQTAITSNLTFPLVFKPLDGTSCNAISRIKAPEEIEAAVQKIRTQSICHQFIVQEYVTGLAASVSLISNGSKAVAVSLNKQQITLQGPEGESCYEGGCVPLDHPLKARALSMAEHLVESFFGLRGYVGVDVVLGDDSVYIVDVNPRLTSSYVGLHVTCALNLAQSIVDAITLAKLPEKCACSSVAFFAKCQTAKPTPEVFQKIAKQTTVVAPPFPIEESIGATAIVLGEGDSMQDACLRLEEAKKNLHSILS